MTPASRNDRDVLPDTVVPINYALSIHDIELGGKFSYQGTVLVTAKIRKSTKEIILNSHQLVLQKAGVHIVSSKTEHTIHSEKFSYDVSKQRATITFDDEIPATETATIIIKFSGTINNAMAGFYRSKYKPITTPAASVPMDGEHHVMFSTQFESSDARRAFPCWDEPNLKATFDVEIELPDDQVALSNMPEQSTRKAANGKKIVSFERTPIMSTYLLAWAVGDFEYVEAFTKRQYSGKHLPVRVYTTKGLKEQGRYALEHAHQIVDYFSELFKIEYPLPKADLLAVHEFTHGAMENFGLVTYRTTRVLYDEKVSDAKYKNQIAYVVAHELAHQWFGNLVTMDWWSELWLNEGFATWVGWLATDHLHPDWNVWPQFVSEGMQSAFGLDSLRSSHPIEVPVKDALEVDQIFDSISYLKGCSVIRMLASHLGQDVFLQGVSDYLKKHAWGNATTNDLWSALSQASGQDVHTIIDPWVRKIGYPVVTVAEEPSQISVRQSRYLSTGDVKDEEDETTWWVPLGLKGVADRTGTTVMGLKVKEDTIRDVNDDFYKINTDTTGFYRTNYPPARLASLGKQLEKLSMEDKIGIIGDTGALAFSGYGTTPALLAFIEGFSHEKNYLVWSQVLSSLGTVKSVFSEDAEVAGALKAFTLALIDGAVTEVGWDFKADEDYLTGQLRALLISAAGMNGHRSVIKEAERQFCNFTEGEESAIHPSLRETVFRIVVENGGEAEYHALKKYWETTSSLDGKPNSVRAMARVQSTALLPDYLHFLFKVVPPQDAHFGAMALAGNSRTRHAFWTYIKDNFDAIKERLANMVVIDRFVRVSLGKFTDLEAEKEIEVFFKDRDNRGYDRSLAQVIDSIKGRTAYRERDRAVLLEWLTVHNYTKGAGSI